MPASTQLNIRNLPPETVARIKRAAGIRQMSLAEYVTALSELHRELLADATTTNRAKPLQYCIGAAQTLDQFGLGRVEEI